MPASAQGATLGLRTRRRKRLSRTVSVDVILRCDNSRAAPFTLQTIQTILSKFKTNNIVMKHFLSTLLVIFGVISGLSQTNNPATSISSNSNTVSVVQISITMTNRVMRHNVPTALQCQIQNSSTDSVAMQYTGEAQYDYAIVLIGSSGKSYDLGPKNRSLRPIFMNALVAINPGSVYKCDIPISVDNNIPKGAYKLKVCRRILIQKRWYSITSNCLVVQVTT